MPQFCRHNRLVQNCPICSREQSVELRPLVSSSTPRVAEPRERAPRAPSRREPRRASAAAGVTVRRLRNTVDDGYRSPLLPGVKSSEEAARLGSELAFSATRLGILSEDPPGLYAEVAEGSGDIEERTWLAFLIAYLALLETEAPFSAISAVRTSWHSGELPDLDGVATGPRSAHDPDRGTRTIDAYRAWAARAGSQAAAFAGEGAWSPERRFARVFERLALPGLHRDARFELLVSLGTLGVYELRPDSLQLGGSDQVTVAAKRALGIGDPLLLGRRANELVAACGIPLAALDLAFYNWESAERATGGLGAAVEADPALIDAIESALGI
ncbi:MAG TPA: hypothetical protein VMD09_11425 [Solirubrobacteraceae bacterium]|nr:hypothetical protein [Solirubrobacteraceae bacterium]